LSMATRIHATAWRCAWPRYSSSLMWAPHVAVLPSSSGLHHRDVRHEVVGRRAVPVPLAWRRVDHVTGPDLEDLPAAGLHRAASFGHV